MTFQSKVEIRAETPIMGVPVWTLFVGVGAYVLWNNQRYVDLEQKRKEDRIEIIQKQALDQAELQRMMSEMEKTHAYDNAENIRQIQELRAILSEIKRDEKDVILRENAVLKEKLQALEK